MSAPTPPPTCDNCYRELERCSYSQDCHYGYFIHINRDGKGRTHFCRADHAHKLSQRWHAQTGGYRGRHRYEASEHGSNALCHRLIHDTHSDRTYSFFTRIPACDCGNEADQSWCDDDCARRSYLALAHADRTSR